MLFVLFFSPSSIENIRTWRTELRRSPLNYSSHGKVIYLNNSLQQAQSRVDQMPPGSGMVSRHEHFHRHWPIQTETSGCLHIKQRSIKHPLPSMFSCVLGRIKITVPSSNGKPVPSPKYCRKSEKSGKIQQVWILKCAALSTHLLLFW